MGKSYHDWETKKYKLMFELETLKSSLKDVYELITAIDRQIKDDSEKPSGYFNTILDEYNAPLFTSLCDVCDAMVAFDPYKLHEEGVYDPGYSEKIDVYHKAKEEFNSAKKSLEGGANHQSLLQTLLQKILKVVDIITSLGLWDGLVTQYRKEFSQKDSEIAEVKMQIAQTKVGRHLEETKNSFEVAKEKLIDEVFNILNPDIKAEIQEIETASQELRTLRENQTGVGEAVIVKTLNAKIEAAEKRLSTLQKVDTKAKEAIIRDKLGIAKNKKIGPEKTA